MYIIWKVWTYAYPYDTITTFKVINILITFKSFLMSLCGLFCFAFVFVVVRTFTLLTNF